MIFLLLCLPAALLAWALLFKLAGDCFGDWADPTLPPDDKDQPSTND